MDNFNFSQSNLLLLCLVTLPNTSCSESHIMGFPQKYQGVYLETKWSTYYTSFLRVKVTNLRLLSAFITHSAILNNDDTTLSAGLFPEELWGQGYWRTTMCIFESCQSLPHISCAWHWQLSKLEAWGMKWERRYYQIFSLHEMCEIWQNIHCNLR